MDADETLSDASSRRAGKHHPATHISGDDLGRILSLSDGVFAFALTLLALSLAVPVIHTNGLSNGQVSSTLAAALHNDYNAFFGYIFAFVMIGVWWMVHNRTFHYIARYDSALVWLNLALLLQIAVMPFVMSVYSAYSNTQVAIDLFAGIQVGLGITGTLLWDYARRAKLLKPNVPDEIAVYFSWRGYVTSAVFAISIGVSFVNLTAAQVCWIGTFVVPRLLDRTQGGAAAE